MRAIYEAESVIDACLVRDFLLDAGIHAEVVGQDLSGSFGLMPGLVRVLVAAPEWREAERQLQGFLPLVDPPLPGRKLDWSDPLPQPA